MCVGEGCWWWMNASGRVGGEGAIQLGGCWKMSSEEVSWVICSSLTITLVWKWTFPPPHLVSCNLVHVGENACRGKPFYFSDRLDICIDLPPICSKVWIEMLWDSWTEPPFYETVQKIGKIVFLWSAGCRELHIFLVSMHRRKIETVCSKRNPPWHRGTISHIVKIQKWMNQSSLSLSSSLSPFVESNWGSNS